MRHVSLFISYSDHTFYGSSIAFFVTLSKAFNQKILIIVCLMCVEEIYWNFHKIMDDLGLFVIQMETEGVEKYLN